MKKNKFRFPKIILFSFTMLAFILDEPNPFSWSQDSRIGLIVWIFTFTLIASLVDALRGEQWDN
jgi:hypothetical protein